MGVQELRNFLHKVERKFDRCKLGFFVAPGGFTQPFQTELRGERKGDKLVVVVGPTDLANLIASKDRNEMLRQLHERAVIEMNGH